MVLGTPFSLRDAGAANGGVDIAMRHLSARCRTAKCRSSSRSWPGDGASGRRDDRGPSDAGSAGQPASRPYRVKDFPIDSSFDDVGRS